MSQIQAASPAVPSRRRWRSFSLRSLLIAFTVVSIWLGSWLHRSREQEQAIKAIREQSKILSIWYENKFANEKNDAYGTDTEVDADGRVQINLRSRSRTPEFLEKWLGKDYFHDAIAVTFTGAHDQDELFRHVARVKTTEQLTPHVAVRDRDIGQIVGLRRLKRLDLMDSSPDFTDDSLEMLAQMGTIEALTISAASITDRGLAALARMTQLKELELGKMSDGPNPRFQITDAGVAQLGSLTNLRRLKIDSPMLSGEGLRHLTKLTKLNMLGLNGNRITDDDLTLLAKLPNLRSLTLRNATFTGVGFAELRGLTKLSWLHLEGSNIGDEAIQIIAQLPALYSLGIDEGNFSATGLEQLTAAKSLYQVQIRSPVSGDLTQLKQKLPNRSLYIGGAFLQ